MPSYGGFRSIAPPAVRPTTDPADVVQWWKQRIEKPLFVYVIQDGNDGMVKIGKAYNPIARLRELQCGNPNHLALRAVVLAHYSTEDSLHRQWRHYLVRGEWFGSWVRPSGKPDRYGMRMVPAQPADHPNVQEEIVRLGCEAQSKQIDALLAGTLCVIRNRETDPDNLYRHLLPARNELERVNALGELALQTIQPPDDWPAYETWPKVPR